MCRTSWIVELAVFGVLANVGVQSAKATTIAYNADVVPDDLSLQSVFSTQVMAACSWSVANGELTMNTVYGQHHGIWFGNYASYDQAGWQLAESSGSNSLSVRARLASYSGEWTLYINDGAYRAGWELFEGGVRYCGPNGEYVATLDGLSSLYSIDTQAYHTYSFCLANGKVSYSIDGAPIYSGAAMATIQSSQNLAIGDTSGNAVSGYGSMIVDQVMIETASVPEPSILALMSIGVIGVLAYAWRRRQRAA